MSNVSFDWDIDKNTKNYEKHGVTFEEASTNKRERTMYVER